MAITEAHSTEIYYETQGDPDHPTLLLVNGLGSQLINWHPEFCQLFVDRGFHVVVFDNRDVGLSAKTEGAVPDMATMMDMFRSGEPVSVPYTLSDMAADGFAVLDAVGATKAHIAGMSMGGMIVQRMAIDRPDRVLSMTSIMSSTGNPKVGRGTPEGAASLMAVAPSDRDGFIEFTVENRRITGGTHHEDEYWRTQAGLIYDRMYYPAGPAFQLAAVASDGDRTEALGQMTVPSLVVHGRLDPLIGLSGGQATAAAIKGAELLVIDEMGHDLPRAIWGQIVASMTELAGPNPT